MKTKTDMDERILAIAEPVAEDLGLNIVRIRVMGNKRTTVQIMAERKSDGQMDVQNCADLSRAMSAIMEVEDPIIEGYALEVSSPGVDRPLTTPDQFARHEGYLARIELDRLVEGRKRFRGILAGVEDGDQIGLDIEGEDDTAFMPFDWIAEAKLLITDELIAEGQKRAAAMREPNLQEDK